MKTKIVTITYLQQHHEVELNDIDSLSHLRIKISRMFNKLPTYYEFVMNDQYGIVLNHQDFYDLKQNQIREIRLVVKPFQIERSQVIDILQESYFEANASKIHQSSLLYELEQNQSQEKNQSLLKSYNQKQNFKRKENEPIQSIKELPIQQKERKQEQVLNEDIQCDGCFAFPFKGTIYKCLYCPNYDLCSKCEKIKHTYHPFLKISEKNHYPIDLSVKFTYKSKRIMSSHERQSKLQEEKAAEQYRKQLFQDQKRKEKIVDPSKVKAKKVYGPNILKYMFE